MPWTKRRRIPKDYVTLSNDVLVTLRTALQDNVNEKDPFAFKTLEQQAGHLERSLYTFREYARKLRDRLTDSVVELKFDTLVPLDGLGSETRNALTKAFGAPVWDKLNHGYFRLPKGNLAFIEEIMDTPSGYDARVSHVVPETRETHRNLRSVLPVNNLSFHLSNPEEANAVQRKYLLTKLKRYDNLKAVELLEERMKQLSAWR